MIKILLIVLGAVTVLVGLFILSSWGRSGHKGLEALRGHVYAHRGLHTAERPENSMVAFRAALEKGYGIELDIHLLSDGGLAVIHDHSLKRTTGEEGVVEELTTAQLKQYHLEGTGETIPTFREVLELFDGQAPIIVELKAGKDRRALVDAAMGVLKDYDGPYCIESFDPRCLWHLRRRYPHVIRGQLSQNFFRSEERMPCVLKFALTHVMGNFLTRPDFVAYRFSHRKALGVTIARKIWHVQGVAWTLTSQKAHDKAVEEGYLPIFEYYDP